MPRTPRVSRASRAKPRARKRSKPKPHPHSSESIVVDDRAGSKELFPYLPIKLCKLSRLEYGDVSFLGNGRDGTVRVGYELKTVPDLLRCIHDGRFAGHQLPGMQELYDVYYLVVIGRVACDPSGVLMMHKGTVGRGRTKSDVWAYPFGGRRYPITLADFRQWLTTIEIQGGARVRRYEHYEDTANAIVADYKWWSRPWDSHKSLKVFDDSREFALFGRPSLKRKIAAQLPGIGWKRSSAVAKHFPTVLDMVTADVKEWLEIEGIGPKIAARIREELRK